MFTNSVPSFRPSGPLRCGDGGAAGRHLLRARRGGQGGAAHGAHGEGARGTVEPGEIQWWWGKPMGFFMFFPKKNIEKR